MNIKLEIQSNEKVLEAISYVLEKVPPIKKGKIDYVFTGGAAIHMYSGYKRKVSDLDIIANEENSPERLYRYIRRLTKGKHMIESLNIDVQSLTDPIYGAVKINAKQLETMIANVSFHGYNVPTFSPEAIVACKLGSTYVMNDTLRNKDVEDIFMLHDYGLNFIKLKELLNYIPKNIMKEKYMDVGFVVEKALPIRKENEKLAYMIIKNSRKIALKLNNSSSKVNTFYGIVKDIESAHTEQLLHMM